MGKFICALLMVGLYTWCNGQTTQKPTTKAAATTTQQPSSTTPYPFQNAERGLILTTFHDYGDEDAAQIRHLPMYPGFENFSGLVPGIGFTNPNIHFMSIDVDYKEKSIFAYDYHLRAIAVGHGYNKDLNVSQMEFDFFHVGVSRGTVQLAYDWLSGTLYWSDYVFRWIIAAPTKKELMEKDYYSIVADTLLDGPDGITLDPLEGYLFWTDNGKHPKIERAELSGKNRQRILHDHLVSPLTLEADIFGKRIYWIDSYTESILSVKYDGSDFISVQRVPNADLLDLAIFRECIYVTDITNSEVYTFNTTKGLHLGKSESTDISIYPEIIYGLAVYSDETQPVKSRDYCAEKMCEHICVTNNKTGAECLCSIGYKLNANGRTCDVDKKSYLKAIVTANSTHICLVDIRSFAHMYYEPLCIYTAIKQRIPPTTTTSMPPAARRRKRQAGSTLAPNTTVTPQTRRPNTTVPATTTTPAPTAAPDDMIKMFDMDMENRILYFATANNNIYKRPIDLPIENDVKELVVAVSGNISGLAFDAVSEHNLYWCESEGNVKVINTESKASDKLNQDDMFIENARDIILLLNQSKLAVLAGMSGDMSIQTMTLKGKDSKVIVSSTDISAFAYDTEKRLFYYVSGTTVYSISSEGTDRRPVFYGIDRNVFRLIVYKNFLTWLFVSGSYAHLVRTYDIVTKTNVALGYFDNSTLVDMKVLDTLLQTTEFTSPCVYENGNCSQLCLPDYVNGKLTATCDCRLGFTLAANGKSCVTKVVVDSYLLVTDWTNEVIQQIDLQTNDIHAVPGDDGNEYMGVYFDPDRKKVILAEYYDSKIMYMNLNGTDRRLLSDLGYSGYAYRFDKDMTTKNLYFTSYYDTFIGAVLPNGEYLKINDDFTYYNTLNDIVVHPGKGWMYYTVTDWSTPYVGRSDMDGKNSVKLIYGDHVDTPDGLAIDYTKGYLYWSDAHFDTIIRCDFEGQNCLTIINMTKTYRNEEIRDLVIDGNSLYYSAYKKDHVIRVDLTTFDRTPVGQSPGLGKLDTISYYYSKYTNIQPESTGCRDRNGLGDCSTICLPSSATPYMRTCACERGISLKADDDRTCSNVYQCTKAIKQPQRDVSVTFSETCLRHLNDKCDYKCPENYKPVFNTLLTCTKVGWDRESQTLCQEIRCPATIKNGAVSKTCEREIGEKCNYTCNEGFTKSQPTAVCTKYGNGTYHLADEDLCTPFQCSATIDNGNLDRGCSKNIGSSCRYTCDKYYTPSDKKSVAVCRAGGWIPTDLCIERECEDASLSDGLVSPSCTKKVGEACTFQCNQGYMNATTLTVCKNDYKWHPEQSCKPLKCSSSIPNGGILATGSCDLSIGSTCNFLCNKGYQAARLGTKLLCKSTGMWNVTDGLCSEMTIKPEKQTQDNGISENGVIVGVIVLVLIIIALVGAIIFLIRRNMSKPASNYATASFRQNGGGGGIAIENPGYLQNNEPAIQVKDEHPYSSVDPSQMQPVTFAQGAGAADDGIANPMYDKEPLPDVGQVDMSQDKTVLTYDSWLKEREKQNSDKF